MKTKYRVGDEVYWNDPDEGISSGYYTVKEVYPNGIYLIFNGITEAEVFEHELS